MNLSFLKKICPVIFLCLAMRNSPLIADPPATSLGLVDNSTTLTCDDYIGHFDSLQNKIFHLKSRLTNGAGESLSLIDLQEEFDRLSAQLSIYQGLQSLREETTRLIREANPSSELREFRETFVNLVIAENVLEMAEDFDHNTTASESAHQQFEKHIKDKCRSESAKYAFCQLNDIENPETVFMIGSLISAYEIAKHNPSPSRLENSPFVKEFHTLFNNDETEKLLNKAYFKLREGKTEDEQNQIREYYEQIGNYYSPMSPEQDIPEIDHKNVKAKIEELEERLKIFDEAIQRVVMSHDYKDMDRLKNYVALKMNQTCPAEDLGIEFVAPSDSTCFQNLWTGGIADKFIEFSGIFLGFVSEDENQDLIMKNLEDLCKRQHRRLRPLRGDELVGPLRHYNEVYAPFCSPWNEEIDVIAENPPPHTIPPRPLTAPSEAEVETNNPLPSTTLVNLGDEPILMPQQINNNTQTSYQNNGENTEPESPFLGLASTSQRQNNGVTTEEGAVSTPSDIETPTPTIPSGTTQPLLPPNFTFSNPQASFQSGIQIPSLYNPSINLTNVQQDEEDDETTSDPLPSSSISVNSIPFEPPSVEGRRFERTEISPNEEEGEEKEEEEATISENSDSQFESPDLETPDRETPKKNSTVERYFKTPSFGSFPRTTIYRDSRGSVTGSYTRAKGHVPWLMAAAQTTASMSNWFTTDYIPTQNYLSNPLINNELLYYVPPANNPWANFTNQKTWNSYIQYMNERTGSPNPFANPAYFNRTHLQHVPYGPSFNPAYRPNFGLPQ